MKTARKCRIAVLAAAVLLMIMCSVTVLAADSAGSREDSPVSQSQADGEGIPEEEIEIEIFDGLTVHSGMRDTLFIAGAILVLAGAAGFLCMFLWKCANKRRDRTQETRDGILDEIEQAERRNSRQKARKQKEKAAPHQDEKAKQFDTQEHDFSALKSAEIVKETPIVPSTPVSMQPNEKMRPRVQPIPVRSVQTEDKPAEPAPDESKAEQKSGAAQSEKVEKYDLEDILREIREGKI